MTEVLWAIYSLLVAYVAGVLTCLVVVVVLLRQVTIRIEAREPAAQVVVSAPKQLDRWGHRQKEQENDVTEHRPSH